MKIVRLIILFSSFSFVCCINSEKENISTIQKSTDWENDNLCEKVKTVELYSAKVINSNFKETETPRLQGRTTYNENGKIILAELFDAFEEVIMTTSYLYDEKGRLAENIIEGMLNDKVIRHVNEFDENDSVISVSVYYNDSLVENDFSENNFQEDDVRTYSIYDKNGNLIEDGATNPFFGEMRCVREYDRQSRIKKMKTYQNDIIESETSFDEYGNPVLVKHFFNGKQGNSVKNKYTYDKFSNWIQKNISVKERGRSIPSTVETRKIEYYTPINH